MIPCAPVLRTVLVALAFVAGIQRPAARANPAGDVAGAGIAAGDQVQFRADYEYDIDTAAIAREYVGPGVDPLGPVPRRRELDYRAVRQAVTPRVELGIYHDVWVSFAAPIVIAQSSELDLAAGVDRTASTFSADAGILPPAGFDARAPATPPTGNVVFRGIQRAGVPELRGGIGFAPMNQVRDDTKPTWKLGAEVRFAIGRVMRFDAVEPGRETGVSTGVHELRVWTSVDRRYRYFEGWFEAFYQRPLYRRGTALYKDPGFGAINVDPAQTAGAAFGLEAYLADSPSGSRLSLDLGARLTAHFEGRGYSEMWEPFAFAGDRRTAGPLTLDADPITDGRQPLSHPGVTNIENYLETAARLALRGRIGRHITLSAIGELSWRTDHVISFTDAGVDLPTCPATPRCEVDDNDVINPTTAEVNPLHARRIDLVGHRYRAEAGRGIVLGAELHLAF